MTARARDADKLADSVRRFVAWFDENDGEADESGELYEVTYGKRVLADYAAALLAGRVGAEQDSEA